MGYGTWNGADMMIHDIKAYIDVLPSGEVEDALGKLLGVAVFYLSGCEPNSAKSALKRVAEVLSRPEEGVWH